MGAADKVRCGAVSHIQLPPLTSLTDSGSYCRRETENRAWPRYVCLYPDAAIASFNSSICGSMWHTTLLLLAEFERRAGTVEVVMNRTSSAFALCAAIGLAGCVAGDPSPSFEQAWQETEELPELRFPADSPKAEDIFDFVDALTRARYEAEIGGSLEAYAAFFDDTMWDGIDPRLGDLSPSFVATLAEQEVEGTRRVLAVDGQVTIERVSDARDGWIVTYSERFLREEVNVGGSVTIIGGVNRIEVKIRRDEPLKVVSLALARPSDEALPEPEAPASVEGVLESSDDEVFEGRLDEGKVGDLPRGAPVAETAFALYATNSAVQYALRYALSYNSSYRSFNNDCTNFISQCLYAGGRQMNSGFYRSTSKWWYNAWNQTYTWAGADNLYRNLRDYGPSTSVSSAGSLRLGDIIFADWNGDGVKNHSMIVTEKPCGRNSWDCVRVSYHTNNRRNISMRDVVNSSPGVRLYSRRPTF